MNTIKQDLISSTERINHVGIKKLNYIQKHWYGVLPLWKSWWINGILYKILSISALISTFHVNYDIYSMVMVIISVIALPIWWIVGTWRSASSNKRWGWLAKIIIILSILLTVANISNISNKASYNLTSN